MGSTTTLRIARQYVDAVSAKDFGTVVGLFAEDVVWHQPGDNRFSGTHRGAATIGEMFDGMMAVTEGTFELGSTGEPMVNGALVAVPVRFSAKRDGVEMGMHGVDLLRIEGGRIAEVWLFSAGQQGEDEFWGVA
ncbi:nuclear transport factor 2 family protein [Streptomyces sp. Li-HN-5-11]|uniref:nuclear transport factor 2 family protein n=1 Tax=Streptomyces sp. Li-HN-5-11 TaxID=3075432 RepID=UPI0028A74FD2|nr:nuclear transport factor 2 family protein [Streptomyces sp. Li-HN-5-11]WNM35712.1 nuclear transport factor 2 family protein [Streptomyces sp. Li-HN-5-11]